MNSDPKTRFESRLTEIARFIECGLEGLLTDTVSSGEIFRPARLTEAMRYAVLGGGKRLRPFLLIECARLFDIPQERALNSALAVELIHCYSLVHDDLPAMDDDDLRRGKPTVHKAYDEATAILAGDALQTLAFGLLADNADEFSSEMVVALIKTLSGASGMGGMVGGQVLDMEAESRSFSGQEIARMQAMKTGALIRSACIMGAILGSASENEQAAIGRFGSLAGEAFQLSDDILDQTATLGAMGKAVEKDAKKGKATQVSLLGLDLAKEQAVELCEQAKTSLNPFGAKADLLAEAAEFIVYRSH